MSAAPDQFGKAKRRVSYFYDTEIGNYHYGMGHPMKVRRSYSPKSLNVLMLFTDRPVLQ